MQCKCGGNTTDSTHSVVTARGAENWGVSVWPCVIDQTACGMCGRFEAKVWYCGNMIRRIPTDRPEGDLFAEVEISAHKG